MARSLISRILEFQQIPRKSKTTQGAKGGRKRFPTVSEVELARAEEQLQFRLPPLLRQLYASVGNGGFGPYGIIGIPGGAADDLNRSIVDLYKDYRKKCRKTWPLGFLPISHYGCAVYFCIDCSRKSAPVYRFDTTAHVVDKEPWKSSVRRVSPSLRKWLSDWLGNAERT